MVCAPSHFETACRDTFILSASSSCVRPFFFRSLIILSAKIIKTPHLKIRKALCFIASLFYQKTRLHATNRELSICQQMVAFDFLETFLSRYIIKTERILYCFSILFYPTTIYSYRYICCVKRESDYLIRSYRSF